jgi:alkanesulfonate monooxygenase SsuD/methylene tetrahydromethanopterin reductase-like flavin-dependent oxidoreductase (luciferase family)
VLRQRQPVLLAKQLTSLDILSNGRVIVGVGVGYVEAELNALGAQLQERASRTDEYLEALDALWAHVPDFEGRYVRFHGVTQHHAPQRLRCVAADDDRRPWSLHRRAAPAGASRSRSRCSRRRRLVRLAAHA